MNLALSPTRDRGELLARVRATTQAAREAEAQDFFAVADWADAHAMFAADGAAERVSDLYGPLGLVAEDLDPYALPGGEQFLELGGAGAPVVAEFCVGEVAAAKRMSFDAARRLVGDAVEVRHRLPLLAARVAAGEVDVWRARRLAQATRGLGFDAAAFVDAHVAPFAHKATPAQLARAAQEAAVRFDPETAEGKALDAEDGTYFTIDLEPSPSNARRELDGALDATVAVYGSLVLADAVDLDRAVAAIAADLAACGDVGGSGMRRARTLGELARHQCAMGLGVEEAEASCAAWPGSGRAEGRAPRPPRRGCAGSCWRRGRWSGDRSADYRDRRRHRRVDGSRATIRDRRAGARLVRQRRHPGGRHTRDRPERHGERAGVRRAPGPRRSRATVPPDLRLPALRPAVTVLRSRPPDPLRPRRSDIRGAGGQPVPAVSTPSPDEDASGDHHRQDLELPARRCSRAPDEAGHLADAADPPPDGIVWTSPHGRRYLVDHQGTTELSG